MLIPVGFIITGYKIIVSDYTIDRSDGENLTIDEFIDIATFEQDNNNFSVPNTIFKDVIDVNIKLANGESNRFFYVNNRVEGISMLPTIYENVTLMCIKDFTKDELQINSIIVFNRNRGFVSHRIVDIINDSYITMGDNNMVTDGYVEFEQVHCLVGGIIY